MATAFLYGHYACPHTYVTQGRLDLLASEAPLRVAWRPLVPLGADDWSGAVEKGGSLPETVQSLRRDAAALGLTLSLPPTPPDPRLALQAAEFAADCGGDFFQRLHRAFFRAVFVDGLDVEDRETVERLAEDAGLDREGLRAALDDARYEAVLSEVEAEAERYDVTATPTILLGKYKLVGAAPLDVLGKTLERALADES